VPDEIVECDLEEVPEGAIFKGYQDYFVQELKIEKRVICYRRKRYKLKDGSYKTASIPDNIDGHFGNELKGHIVHQCYVNNVSQEKIHQELSDRGILISKGEINNIMLDIAEKLKAEYYAVANAGISNAKNIRVDDTGARHQGKNGASLVIQNDAFTYLITSDSKSRKNFLLALRGNNSDYIFNEEAIEYIKKYKPKPDLLNKLERLGLAGYDNEEEFLEGLVAANITGLNTSKKFLRIIEEAAIMGSAIEHGLSSDTIVLSDGAKQYGIGIHALCWVHAERAIRKLISNSPEEAAEIDGLRDQIWEYYNLLKQYKEKPNSDDKKYLSNRFDQIFGQTVKSSKLSECLRAFRRNKTDLLRVLEYPHVPLHNNSSELDIRKAVIKRNIAGGTKSNAGRSARDIFISLVGTCRKNRISPLAFIRDRIRSLGLIPYLPKIIQHRQNAIGPPVNNQSGVKNIGNEDLMLADSLTTPACHL
jgi:hypothetical protein